MARANYARRRRNALLAAVAMALVLIIIIVIIIVGIAGRSNKKDNNKGNNNKLPTVTTPANNKLPTFVPDETPDGYPVYTTPGLVTPTPDGNNNNSGNTNTGAGTVMYVTGSTVNVREKASTDSDKIASLDKGTSVTAYEKLNDFWRVKLSDGKIGYISSKYLSEDDPKLDENKPSSSPSTTPDTSKGTKMYVIGDKVNVRESGSTSAEKVASLIKGKEVTAYTTVGDWTYIQYGTGKYGYISSQYLSTTEPSASGSATASSTATSTATAETTPAPTPAEKELTSFADINVAEAVAAMVDGNEEYLKKATKMKGLVNNSNDSTAVSFYTIGSKDGVDFYIVFTGTLDKPTSAYIAETRPTGTI